MMDIINEQLPLAGIGMSLAEKVDLAIATLREYEELALKLSPDGYYLAFSGGKDSVVIKQLAEMAGVRFAAHYNVTTIDPPELCGFIKREHKDVIWERSDNSFFRNIEKHGLPSRLMRWCCRIHKEAGGGGMVKVLGIRAAESQQRAGNWKTLSQWNGAGGGWVVNPILQWSDQDVWSFIQLGKLPYCELYNEGFERLGCIGCPMGRAQRFKQFARWPRFEELYRRGARRYWEKHKTKGACAKFNSGDEFFDWWLSDNPSSADEGCQMGMF